MSHVTSVFRALAVIIIRICVVAFPTYLRQNIAIATRYDTI